MRVSLNVVRPFAGTPIDTFVDELAAVRDAGFRRVWMAQSPLDGDLLTALAIALREVDDIEVGTAVLPIQTQHPTLLAQRALTLNAVAGGRLLLGLGLSHQPISEGMWGIPYAACVNTSTRYNPCWLASPSTPWATPSPPALR
jgi:5,10-methylenetetrahydromethanopterin reductase